MEVKETLNILPRKLILFGYVIPIFVATIFIFFFIVIIIPQKYEIPVELSYTDNNRIVGYFPVLENQYDVFTSDSIQIYVDNIKVMGIIRKTASTENSDNVVYVDIRDFELIFNNFPKNRLLPKAYIRTTIKSTFWEKIIKKQSLK